jgi:heme/copper-type cytochrome/quinol oxidase subunit 2
MKLTRRSFGLMAAGAGLLLAGPAVIRLFAQDQAPNRRELTIVVKDFHYTPDRIEVTQDDLVKLTIRSADAAHGFAIDEYRIVKRVQAGGATTFEFRADRAGTFPFYCNLTGESGHQGEHGLLVVKSR